MARTTPRTAQARTYAHEHATPLNVVLLAVILAAVAGTVVLATQYLRSGAGTTPRARSSAAPTPRTDTRLVPVVLALATPIAADLAAHARGGRQALPPGTPLAGTTPTWVAGADGTYDVTITDVGIASARGHDVAMTITARPEANGASPGSTTMLLDGSSLDQVRTVAMHRGDALALVVATRGAERPLSARALEYQRTGPIAVPAT